MKIRVAITDDHSMVRVGLRNMLQLHDHIEVVAEYEKGSYLLNGLRQNQPDVLLLDLQMPDMTGIELVPIVKKEYPNIRIIILTSNDNVYNIKMLLNAGANGYVLKNVEQELLVQAIEQVYNTDETFLSNDVKDALVKISGKNKNGNQPESLTPREIDILRLIVAEHTSHEIGEQLHLSYRTVESYRLGLMQKLGVKNMVGMAKKAIILGLIKE